MPDRRLTPSRSMSSRRQLVLEFIRRHFRAVGASPSHSEIAAATGLARQHVGGWLDELQAAGLITYQRGRPRSIALVDRMANYSDTELRLACVGRGWTISLPPTATPFADCYAVDPVVPDYGLPLLDALKHVP